MQNNTPSPYFDGRSGVEAIRNEIIAHLERLRIPLEVGEHHCSKECHAIERNYTIDALKYFIESLEISKKLL